MTRPKDSDGMTLAEMVKRARETLLADLGNDECWQDLANNRSVDHESCYLCSCDIDFMGTRRDSHEEWCPTYIARLVLGFPPQKTRDKS